MIRKISKHGNASLSVSLPVEWVRNNKLKGGEQVEVQVQSNKLMVLPFSNSQEPVLSVEFKKSRKLAEYVTSLAYRYGVDQLVLKYPAHFLKEINHSLENNTIGFEIVEQSENSCLIKDMSKDAEQDFDILLRRMWLVGKGMVKDLTSEKITPEVLQSIQQRDKYLNKYKSYLTRLVLKKNLFDKKSYGYLNLINNLESTCDGFKWLAGNWHIL